jgi:peptidoglycan/xylan/chitin deacetylase (PgdA/CDA1 family)
MRRTVVSVTASLALALGLGGAAAATASAATGANLMANPGLEVGGGASGPAWWAPSTWTSVDPPTTQTNFTWPTDAHTGDHSVEVDVSNYSPDGDSKWLPQYVPVKPNTYYTFSDWYKSTLNSAVSVNYVLNSDPDKDDPDAQGHWANLFSGIEPRPDWKQFETGFTMPADVVKARFVHFIAGDGWLRTDDYSLNEQESPPGFGRPMISLTFDDGSQGFWANARQPLKDKGFETTQYVPTKGLTDASDPFLMTETEISTLAQEGNEIGGHSETHPYLTKVSNAQLTDELVRSKKTLEGIPGVGTVHNFAYPYGDYDSRVIDYEIAAGYRSGRSVEEGYNSKLDLEPYDIRVQNMTPETTVEQFKSWLEYAKAHNYWLVIVYHEVQPDSVLRCPKTGTMPDPCLGDYDTKVSEFQKQLDAISDEGLGPDVLTVEQALDTTDAEMRPVAGAVNVTPTSPLPGTTLTANPTGFSDPDNDALTYHYQWKVNGTPVAGATDSTFTAGNAGDVVSVDLTASDPGGRTSAGVSDSVTVATPPTSTPGAVVTPVPTTPSHPAPPVATVDRKAPKIAVSSPRARTYKVGQLLKIKLSFSDASGRVQFKATLRRGRGKAHAVKQGAKVRLSRIGRYVLHVTAKDRWGNSATKTVHFRVVRK